ncbi:MAG: 5-oxoprolinase [Bacteroidetes bacterium]|nr:5-oxoprolinase [Bacteroidota bacterium]
MWQIQADTGGTFTDCIAISPDGKWLRTKVLSSGVLRATIQKEIRPGKYLIQHNWSPAPPIFTDWMLRLSPKGKKTKTYIIRSLDPVSGILTTDKPLQNSFPATAEITAREEAPVLAARLLTATPLNQSIPPCHFRLGTTKGTNALLEHKGAKTLLLITKGFGELLQIGNQQRPDLFQLNIPPRTRFQSEVLEVQERLNADGHVLKSLTTTEVDRIINRCREIKPEAIAISLMHAYLNPTHEKLLEAALRKAGFKVVSASANVASGIGLLARTQTTVINTYLQPVLDDYIQSIKEKISAGKLYLMTSAGGLWPQKNFRPVDSLLSGPAGGVVGAQSIAQRHDFERMLSFDMGGTSTDTAHYNQAFDYNYQSEASDWELLVPALGIETVAAGGGSICYLKHGRLQVGPESAGASPGPACYGAGGPLTITDINLLSGKLDPASLPIPIDPNPALQKLDQLIATLIENNQGTYSREDLLEGFTRIANEKMADAIRRISVAAGFNPADYPLVAFGGAGGLHACKLAEQLNIREIILPKDGGLLSAYGIGQARIQRWAEKQILESWDAVMPSLSDQFSELRDQALQQVQSADNSAEAGIQKEVGLLRFRGQNDSLEIDWEGPEKSLSRFREKYQNRYGHIPDGQLEVVEIRVLAAGPKAETDPEKHSPERAKKSGDQKIIPWASLSSGQQIKGPCILTSPFSTAFIEPGWELEMTDFGDVLVKQHRESKQSKETGEAIQLELFTNRFTAIAREMGAMLQRTAFSVNIRERLDFSCGLLDPDGYLLVNAPHIPVHLGSLGICARLSLAACPVQEGEILITNHPKYGGSHLPDVTLLAPVYDSQKQLAAYVINRAHHAEIGGKSPGSMPPDAKNLAEEGVVIPPTIIAQNGKLDIQKLKSIFNQATYPSRSIAENLADIRAGVASLQKGQQNLKALVDAHGLPRVKTYMDGIRRQAEKALQRALQRIGEGQWEASEKLDDGHKIQLKIKIKNAQISFDFSGSSGVHPGNLNANRSIVYSAILYVLRVLCQDRIPLNEGLLEPVDIILPESFLHPTFPDDPLDCPAVVGGNTEVSQRLTDALLYPFDLAACGQGTMNNFLFGNDRFGYYETIGGGSGAGPGFAGRDAVHQHMTNTRITDPEVLEKRYPVRLCEFSIRKNSGGKGKWSGGNGIVREIEFLEPVTWTLISQHRKEAPYGKKGGDPGMVGEQWLIKKDGEKIRLSGIESRQLEAGDRIRLETPGGGGWEEEM